MLLMGAHLAHHGAIIFATLELHQRRTDMEDIPFGAAETGNHPGHRRRHIHQRLGRFHRQEHLIDRNGITGAHLPFDDLGFGQPFTQIR